MKRIDHICLCILLLCRMPATAQVLWPFNNMLARIKENNLRNISYDYSIVLENISLGQRTDSMSGHIVSGKKGFIDSNKLFLLAKSAGMYCKLDHSNLTAEVYDLKQLSQKINMPLIDEPNRVTGLTEELLKASGAKVSYDLSNPALYRMSVHLKGQALSYVRIDFNRSDYSIAEAYFELEDDDPGQFRDHYKRIFHLHDVRYDEPDAIIDCARFANSNNGQPVLQKKYARYKIINHIQ